MVHPVHSVVVSKEINGKKERLYRVIHERGTSEFLFCRNQQYQWQ
jgi:hypothetical protein